MSRSHIRFRCFGVAWVVLLFAAAGSSAQTAAPVTRAGTDTLGLTCSQILQMSSADWVAKYAAAKVPSAASTVEAIAAFGKCYDARTDRLAASLAKAGKGPLMGARGDFGDFEQAVKDFSAKALAVSQPPADAVKIAYANLYEKQFRYAFYQGYESKPVPAPSTKGVRPSGKSKSRYGAGDDREFIWRNCTCSCTCGNTCGRRSRGKRYRSGHAGQEPFRRAARSPAG